MQPFSKKVMSTVEPYLFQFFQLGVLHIGYWDTTHFSSEFEILAHSSDRFGILGYIANFRNSFFKS